jgi:tetratricopeptide (TPR) repeat protein
VVVQKVPQGDPNYGNFLDTYANLLFELGQPEKAIAWEQKVVDWEPNEDVKKDWKKTVERMIRGEKWRRK